MKLRQGRKNGHNLYVQRGAEPASDDPCIGFMLDPDAARVLVDEINAVNAATYLLPDTDEPPAS